MPARKVLVMAVANWQDFFKELSEQNPGLECHFASYNDVGFEIINGTVTCSIINHGTNLTDYDLIFFKSYAKKAEIAAAMAETASQQGIEFIDKEVGRYQSLTKLTQYVKLACNGIGVPDSIVLPPSRLKGQYEHVKDKLGLPFVMKDVASQRGESNYLINSLKDYKNVQKKSEDDDILFVCQRFVKNDGDYRMIVLGGDVEMVIHRIADNTTTHINNTSTGGRATLVKPEELEPEPLDIAVKATAVVNRQVAGVDLVFDLSRKEWLVFEVNNGPQIASGSYLKVKQKVMSNFLYEYAGGSV